MPALTFARVGLIAFAVTFALYFFGYVEAEELDPKSAYRFVKEYPAVSIKVPTVVEVPLAGDTYEVPGVAVFDVASSTFEPSYVRTQTSVKKTAFFVESTPSLGASALSRLYDGRYDTHAEFQLQSESQGVVDLVLKSDTPIQSSSLTLVLPAYVTLPNTVAISAVVNGTEQVVVAKRPMTARTVQFPETTADEWKIALTYGQPLRIAEVDLRDDASEKTTSRFVRFLAQPGHAYHIYIDPDRYVLLAVGESPNLASATGKDVKTLENVPAIQNAAYVIADTDGDTVPDIVDNCVSVANTDQIDVNENGRGDVCDDFDRDGVTNSSDNCINEPNRNQADEDGDGVGDLCDGEESRLTEKYAWLPWVGMGLAAVVIIGLFGVTVVSMRGKVVEEKKGIDMTPSAPPAEPPPQQ